MKSLIVSISMALAVSACVAPPQKMNVAFDAGQFAPFVGQGTATVTGQAFLKTRGGDVKVGAGNQVELVAITPYIQERLDRATINNEKMEPRDPGVLKFVRTTVADAGGNFEFKSVPAGRYAVYCDITWMTPGPYGGSITGGVAYGVVTLKDGESVKVIVTR
ncbi:MAG: hypothetical protein Q7T07_17130 [Burkholderiaceae bacterium]|nr:hypothetical protein [Burkholderiaceae bacterium]